MVAGNPKGTFYDAGIAPTAGDAGLADSPADAPADARAPRDAAVAPPDVRIQRKGNPKGSLYDEGTNKDDLGF